MAVVDKTIRKLIHLTGMKPNGYTVVLSGLDGCSDLWVPSYLVGTAIVRAMREHAANRWAQACSAENGLSLTDLFDHAAVRKAWGLDPL